MMRINSVWTVNAKSKRLSERTAPSVLGFDLTTFQARGQNPLVFHCAGIIMIRGEYYC